IFGMTQTLFICGTIREITTSPFLRSFLLEPISLPFTYSGSPLSNAEILQRANSSYGLFFGSKDFILFLIESPNSTTFISNAPPELLEYYSIVSLFQLFQKVH